MSGPNVSLSHQGTPELVDSSECQFTFRWESINACPVHLPYTNTSKDVCSIEDTSSEFTYDFTNLVKSTTISTRDPNTNTMYVIQLCGTVSQTGLPSGCNTKDTGICRVSSGSNSAKTLVSATHKIVLTSHTPHTVEVVFKDGARCDSTHNWTAVVSLQCSSRENSHPHPVLVSADDCRLDLVWQNASFCVGEESCSVVDSNGHVYNFDGLFSHTWTVSLCDNHVMCVMLLLVLRAL